MDKSNRSKIDPLAHEVLAWHRQGDSYRRIEKRLKEDYGLKVSYRTIQAWLVRHPELAGDQATAPPDKDDEDNAAAPAREPTETAPAPPPAEDLAALRAALDELTKKYHNLQTRSAAQEAEIIALTEQRSPLEAQPMPGAGLTVYSGSWEHDLPLLPEPIDIAPASPRPLLRRVLTLGIIAVLLALCALAFYLAFQDMFTHAYVTAMHMHGPFTLLATALLIAGLGLGLRVKALVPVGLALVTYLLMLRNAPIPFFIALVLTIQVSKALVCNR